MYEAQFLLKRRPFGATPDPRCFLAAGQIQSALDELIVCVEQGQGVSVVSAPAGTGKTLLCERLRSELESRFHVVLLPHASFLTRRAILQSILADLNHSYRRQDEQELRLELAPAIRALIPQREAMVLILDEAHTLTEDLLEELRILSDLSDHGRPLVRLVLVGQPGLEETLALPGAEALNQRIRAHVCLDSFDRVMSLDYIDYRITWAGGRTSEVFTPEALELIYRASEGVARCINQLCDHALLLAYVAEQKPVTAETVREALKDLRQLPLHWNESLLSEPSERNPIADCLSEAEPELISSSSETLRSVEFGADLPSSDSDFESVEPGEGDQVADEPLAEATRVHDHKPIAVTFMETTSSKESSKNNSVSPRQSPGRFETIAPGVVVEEIVSDRYAAIDGGFPMPPVVQTRTEATLHTSSVAAVESWSDTPSPPSVHLIQSESQLHSEEIANNTTDTFEDACGRLNQVLPEVRENPGWDPASIEIAFKTRRSSMATEADEWGSLEEELGISVCELASEVQAETKSDNNTAIDQLHRLVGTQATTIEVGVTETVTSSTSSAMASPDRPYRNLFSRLRRKQQGLL